MSHFVGELDVRLVDDIEGIWELLSPFGFWSDELQVLIQAYRGMRCDFMSVPRLPFIYAKLGNRGHKLGVIHDLTYKLKMFPRRICDDLMLEMAPLCGFSKEEAWEIYVPVRMCGEPHYGSE